MARILFTVTNQSSFTVGGASRKAEIRCLAGSGDFDMKKISFTFDGREQNLEEPYIYELPEIEAKTTQVVEAHIKIPQDVGFLLKGQFLIELHLLDPRNEAAANPCIHAFAYDIRTGFHYQPVPEQDVVFVINEKTHLQEVTFIQQMCAYYGLKHNFYDVSMHGTLDLFKPLPHLQTCLAEDLKEKTLVILNNDFAVSSTSQDTVTAWTLEFLRKD